MSSTWFFHHKHFIFRYQQFSEKQLNILNPALQIGMEMFFNLEKKKSVYFYILILGGSFKTSAYFQEIAGTYKCHWSLK